MFAAEINRLDTVSASDCSGPWPRRIRVEERDRIGGVDHDPAVPGGQIAQHLSEIDPAHGDQTISALAASRTVPALIEGPSSPARLASDAGPRLFAIVAEIPLLASSRATLDRGRRLR